MSVTHSESYAYLNKPEIWKYKENGGRFCGFYFLDTVWERIWINVSGACAKNVGGVKKKKCEGVV